MTRWSDEANAALEASGKREKLLSDKVEDITEVLVAVDDCVRVHQTTYHSDLRIPKTVLADIKHILKGTG